MSRRAATFEADKTPNEHLFFGFDFADWLLDLAADTTLDGAAWTITPESSAQDDTPLVNGSASVSGSQANIFLTGGTFGRSYLATALGTCSDGSKPERTIRVRLIYR